MLLQALYDFYGRACRDGLIEDPAFNKKHIRWIIPLTAEGELEGVGLIENAEPKKDGRVFSVPRSGRPKNAGGVAEFLWDGLEGVFGLSPNPDVIEPNEKKRERQQANLNAKYKDFWQQVESAFAEKTHPLLNALLKFREKSGSTPSFLRWGLDLESKNKEKSWWIKTSIGEEVKLKADNFTFQVDGILLLDDETTLRPYWRRRFSYEQSQKEADVEKGLCLVTGAMDAPILPTHLPKINGVPGATSTGALLVSFDKDAFTSYGFDKSYNAPVSSSAVEAYCNALNFLISDKRHRLKIGGTVLCFWARESEDVNDLFARFFDQPRPEEIRSFLTTPFRGQSDHLSPDKEQFYSVTLSGNSGRIVVRHWMQTTVLQAIGNLKQWFEDLDIVTYANRNDSGASTPLALKNLARTTLRTSKDGKSKDEDLMAEPVSALYRAALEGSALSLTVARQILGRFKADLSKNGLSALNNLSRFALLRLILNRNEKEKYRMIDSIISDTNDAAYNCGRLLAIFDDLQMAAHDYKLEGAGVVERYYGSASASPNSAFGILWRLHQHHLKKLARTGNNGRAKAEAIRRKIEDIAKLFRQPAPNQPPQFPRGFDLQSQGRFALGFYQQKASDRAARQAYLDAKKQSGNQTSSDIANLKGEQSND